jgi:hypothetical protein
MERRIKITLAIAAATLLASGTTTAQKVYRWVDEDGNVHYTESLPPDYKDTGHDVLNESGLVVDENQTLTPEQAAEQEAEKQAEAEDSEELPRDSSGLPRAKPLYSEEEKKARMDNFLMLRYGSEQEIVDAMTVEIRQLNYDRRLLEGSRQSMHDAWRGQVRVAAEKQRAGQAISESDTRQINDLQAKLAQTSGDLKALELREENIRARFNVQLERYRFLVEKYSEENSG